MEDKSILDIWLSKALKIGIGLAVLLALYLKGCVYDSDYFERRAQNKDRELQVELEKKYSCDGRWCVNEQCTDDKGMCYVQLNTPEDVVEIKRLGGTMCVLDTRGTQWILQWFHSPIDLSWHGPYSLQLPFRTNDSFDEYLDSIGEVQVNPSRHYYPQAVRYKAPDVDEKGIATLKIVRIPTEEVCGTICAPEKACETNVVKRMLQ
tara:strand:- start:2004 stop:2621 length:618 start_codon:yes stop_codon:yes gene_type:complete